MYLYVAKTKALISFAVTAKLISYREADLLLCFRRYAKRWFSHDAAQIAFWKIFLL